MWEFVLIFVLICSVCLAYIIPGLVASSRNVKSSGTIWVINIFFGWSVIGWIIALALACGESRPQPTL